MKKIALFISILGIFVLASCDDDSYVYESTTSIQTTSNVPTTTEVRTTSNESTSETKDDSSYDDTLPWGPLH